MVAAAELHAKLTPLNDVLFVEPNPIPGKWALSHLGHIQDSLRLPLTTLSEARQRQVAAVLESINS